jgi:hypothetical protein
MTIHHAARSLSEVLLFLPTLLRLPGSPHRLAFAAGGEFALKWAQPFRKFAVQFFRDHIEFVATTTETAADLRATPDPGSISSVGYKHAHALWCGLTPSDLPRQWLPGLQSSRSGVVLARSLFEHNEFFPWERVLKQYSSYPLTFCGTAAEREGFSRKFPKATFQWQDSSDLVAVAQLLSCSQLLIANQCAVAALADGVGTPTVLEVSLLTQNMLHPRNHVFPSFGGRTFLPQPEDVTQGAWVISSIPEALLRVHWPRGYSAGWTHPDPHNPREPLKFPTLDAARAVVAKLYGYSPEAPEVQDSIIHHTLADFPGELLPSLSHKSCQRVVRAIQRFQGPFSVKDYFFQPQRVVPELKLLTSDLSPESSPPE